MAANQITTSCDSENHRVKCEEFLEALHCCDEKTYREIISILAAKGLLPALTRPPY